MLKQIVAQRGLLTLNEELSGRNDGKIAAIKMYRQRTGNSLKESKEAVENHFTLYGLQFKTYG